MTLTKQQEASGGEGERVNKETGELSGSGELAESVEARLEVSRSSSLEDVAGQPDAELRDRLARLGEDARQLPRHQREKHLLQILPLFIQVCEDVGVPEGLDLQDVAMLTGDALVFHIQQRLCQGPAEDARYELDQFFQRTAVDSEGWLLLKATSLLSAFHTVRALAKTGLPAALVKCLYLFVALPSRMAENAGEEGKSCYQELLIQVMLQMCRQVCVVEEMVATQELQCVIIALTSLWDQCSSSWRRQASRVLRVISAAQAPNTVPALQERNCIRICIQNLLKIWQQVAGPVLAEVAVSVFSFVKDSYALSPSLFEEFENNDGYTVLQAIMTRCEEEVAEEDFLPVVDFLGLIASLTLLGRAELKVAICVDNPQPPGFKFDPPLTKGSAVKNLTAFRILQGAFLRSGSCLTCCQILRSVQTIWTWDRANFFLLEWTLQSLAVLGGSVSAKPPPVHSLFFSLLEWVVFQLSYIPHEALRAVLAALRQCPGPAFSRAALESFHRLVRRSGLLAEVLSDGGLMEMLLAELKRRAKVLRKAGVSGNNNQPKEEDPDRMLPFHMLKVVAALALRSIRNTVSIRDMGMIPYIKIFLDDDWLRGPALCILEQLSEVNPDEFMSTTIGALCSSTDSELSLKHDLLQSLLRVLEMPTSWAPFRSAGGFDGLLSLLADLRGALQEKPEGAWASISRDAANQLLFLILNTLVLAVQVHPVNAHFYHSAGGYAKLADALLQLGCFRKEGEDFADEEEEEVGVEEEDRSCWRSFYRFVEMAAKPGSPLPPPLRDSVRLLNFLDQFAMGLLLTPDLPLEEGVAEEVEGDGQHRKGEKEPQENEELQGRSRNMAVSVSSVTAETGSSILHPGAIQVMMMLLPRICCPGEPNISAELQFAVAHHVQQLVRSDQNRQIMCEVGLLPTMLTHCRTILTRTTHPLHLPVVRILEKLASQSIDHKTLRAFMCLGDPLMCGVETVTFPHEVDPAATAAVSHGTDQSEGPSEDSKKSSNKTLKRGFSLLRTSSNSGSAIPLQRIISLVSMTSPRSLWQHQVSATPSFVEFDMRDSGYGCLFLPSLATVRGVSADSISTGGIGSDCRGFPPLGGLSFSCWFLIGRFSAACDAHPVRLLTVVRHMSRAEQHFSCLSINLSSPERCLEISTEEEAYQFLDLMEPEGRSSSSLPTRVRFDCARQLVPGRWHHVVVVLAKDVRKSCKATAYLNGSAIGTAKMRYIQPFPGQSVSMEPMAVIDVCGVIGTPSLWKQPSGLVWRAGPAYLFEEALKEAAVGEIYSRGTRYLGNYLALQTRGAGSEQDEEAVLRLVPAERISFGLNPAVSTVTTVANIRDQYNEVDSRLIAKELGVTSRDNSTPIYLARNISQHLGGASRTIGAALSGRFGVRTFSSHGAAESLQHIGGPAVLLSLVAMASDDSSLYAAMKVLLSVLDTNAVMEREMKRICGYKLLAFLLKMKILFISQRTFQQLMSIIGNVDPGAGTISVHNHTAFQDLLCDFEVWQKASDGLDLSMLKNFADILKSSSAEVLSRQDLLAKLLFLLQEPSMEQSKALVICRAISHLITGHFNRGGINRLGLFLVNTLPPPSLNENKTFSIVQSQALSPNPSRAILIRNLLLEMLSSLLSPASPLSTEHQEELFHTLGPDWFFLFLQRHIHSSTVLLALRLLTYFLANQNTLAKFKEGVTLGTLVKRMEEPPIIMDVLKAPPSVPACVPCACGGFEVLQRMLVQHVNVPQVYGTLAGLLLGTLGSHVVPPPGPEEGLDSILQAVIDRARATQEVQLCVDSACVLLELVKATISRPAPVPEESWEVQYPGSVMQFLCLVHSLFPHDALWASPDFLSSLASVIFPPTDPPDPPDPPKSSTGIHGNEEGGEEVELAGPVLAGPHPSRKPVCDFIRILLMDSLINIPAKDHHHPFIQLLEFCPDGAGLEQKQSFQTEMLEFVMEILHMMGQGEGQATHLLHNDGGQGKQEGRLAILMENVAFFSKILVEKLYTGMFLVEPENLLGYLTEQIATAMEKGQSQREATVSILYKASNKSLLYFLSRPRHAPSEQQLLLRTLRALQRHWDIVMATYNANTHFLTCLVHCLLLIRSGSFPEGFGCEMHKKPSRKIWRYLFPRKNSHVALLADVPDSEVESELLEEVEAVWARVMLERRRPLEEAYKIDMSAKQAGRDGPVAMGDVCPLWEETALKVWKSFIESQQKKVTNGHRRAGLLSGAIRAAQRRMGKNADCNMEAFLSGLEDQRQTAEGIYDRLLKNHIQLLQCERERMAGLWLRVEEELLRERGLFGPGPGVLLTRGWVQDAAEGPARMRARIRRKNLRRSKKVPTLNTELLWKSQTIEESRGVADTQYTDSELRILSEAGREVEEDESMGCEQLTFFPVLSEATGLAEDSTECAETQLILQQLATNEEVCARVSVVLVRGHRVAEGVLLFGRAALYICEHFTLTARGDIRCRDHHPTSVRDSFISGMFNKDPSVSPGCTRWSYEDIKEVHFMRFLLEDNSLEILRRDGNSVFLMFQNKEHVAAYKRLCSVVPSLKPSAAVHNVKRTAVLEKTALTKWQRGEMSNFEYLMHLNTLAGRTYNDLMQYPVFPWILADYESETLDLTSPETFRDLSKPMGAQTERRRENFVQRYNEVESTDGDLSARCHYCTHYSSAIIVASFLVRLEPFSQTFLTLQGGSFDVPERMFHSVQKEWESASRDNMGDVRELIPEFYYLPDFLVNSNNFEFGCMQDGTTLGDVVLPPWAKGDPQEFIRMHREALECDYVSSYLHLWIDLIFGCRQQGQAAVEALNTYHPFFYPDRLHPDAPQDPLEKHTVLGYVSNFGQIPKQLFTKPHPSRDGHKNSSAREQSGANHVTPFFHKMDKLKPSVQPIKELNAGSVGQILCVEKDVLVVEKNKLLIPPSWNTYFSWGYYDNSCSFGNYTTEKSFAVCEGLSDWGDTVCAACPNPNTLVTGGSSSVVCVWDVCVTRDKLKHMRLRQALYGHTDTVLCVCVSEVHGVIVSGSEDETCILWDLEELSYITQLPDHSDTVTAVAINDLTGEIATCAGPRLFLWTMKGQLLATVATSCGLETHFLCCCFTQKQEWDPRNVIVTGCADGIVRIWKSEYTCAQLPGHEENSQEPRGQDGSDAEMNPDAVCKGWERRLVLCQELNRTQAISRRRYKNNPAVTALAISRTHGTLLVGDAWGRVFSWICES